MLLSFSDIIKHVKKIYNMQTENEQAWFASNKNMLVLKTAVFFGMSELVLD